MGARWADGAGAGGAGGCWPAFREWRRSANGFHTNRQNTESSLDRRRHVDERTPRTVHLERYPISWNHLIEKESLKIKELEHVHIEKAGQLFRKML
jgi:hypothetical protein